MSGSPPRLFADTGGKCVISPVTDLLCVGLGSILFFAPLVLFGNGAIVSYNTALLATLTICVNLPHFLASYRILYRTKESALRHKWASLGVPAILVVYLTFAVQQAETNQLYIGGAMLVAALYLAWHYTGQVWGMMATYAFLAGEPFSNRERTLIRLGLRTLLVWHLSWVLQYPREGEVAQHPVINRIYFAMSCATVLAFALGLVGFWLYRRRTGKLPPVNAGVAWLALCFWYGAMARDPEAIFWVQIAHSVQYLIFPARVEINHHRGTHPEGGHGAAVHSLLFFGVLIAIGGVIEWGSKNIGAPMVADIFGHVSGSQFPVAVLAFINIHHYFTDGVIWKISNREVKEELFAHLKRQ